MTHSRLVFSILCVYFLSVLRGLCVSRRNTLCGNVLRQIVTAVTVAVLLTEVRCSDTPVRRFIFTLNPGYSGSGALRRLLDTSPDVHAFHERKPALVDIRYAYLRGLNATYEQRKAMKIPAVYKDLQQEPFVSNPNLVMADTSHLFGKSWFDVFLDEFLPQGCQVDVVHMRRYMPDVLRSALGVGKRAWRPSLTVWVGGEYSLHQRPFAVLDPVANSTFEEDTADLIIGYLLDVEARALLFKSRYGGRVRFHDVFTENLRDERVVRQLFHNLNITYDDVETTKMVSWRSFNGHADDQLRAAPKLAFRVKILHYLLERRRAGLPIPPLPHMGRPTVVEDDEGHALQLQLEDEQMSDAAIEKMWEHYERGVFSKLDMNEQPDPNLQN